MDTTKVCTKVKKASKRQVKHVASRYKPAAILKVSKPSSTSNIPNNGTSQMNKKNDSEINNCTLDITPMICKQGQELNKNSDENNCITSTPNSTNSAFPASMCDASAITVDQTNSAFPASMCDASAITVDQSINVPQLKKNLLVTDIKRGTRFKIGGSSKPNVKSVPVTVLPKHLKRSKSLITKSLSADLEQEIRVKTIHSQYVQAAFLESRARKTIQIHSARAMEQLHRLWNSNQILLEQIKTADINLQTIYYLSNLQKHLNAQEAALEEVIQMMPSLLQQYSEVTEGVDSVRNKLPMTDISYSTNEKLEDDLCSVLTKCEGFLGFIHQNFMPDMVEFSALSELLTRTEGIINEMGKEMKRCNELLSTTDALTVTETSLRISEILNEKEAIVNS